MGHEVIVVPLTKANRPAVFVIAVEAYIGFVCTVCGHAYTDYDDIMSRNPVRSNAPPNEMQLACGECWQLTKEKEKHDHTRHSPSLPSGQ